MKQIESIQFSIHLNLLLAQNSIKENDLNLAMYQMRDARSLLEELEILVKKNEINKNTQQ